MRPIVITIIVLFAVMVTAQVSGWIAQLTVFLKRYFCLREVPDMCAVYSVPAESQLLCETRCSEQPRGEEPRRPDHNSSTHPTTEETHTEPSGDCNTSHEDVVDEEGEGPSSVQQQQQGAEEEVPVNLPLSPLKWTPALNGNPWVVITGGSSGQGREFAMQFARRKFNIVLIGSHRSHATAELVRTEGVECLVLLKNFGKACEQGFFDDIERALAPLDCAILVNNVGHRTGWMPFHDTPANCLQETIVCGTIVQTRMTHMLLPKLLKRIGQDPKDTNVLDVRPPTNSTNNANSGAMSPTTTRSAIIFITAQCMHPNTGFALPGFVENAISVPFLATYEASNAFGYYHAASLIQEYGHVPNLDLLNITPGAVLTENTTHVLRNAPFAIDAHTFVSNIMRFLGGNIASGTSCAHWGHALSNALVGFAPWKKKMWLRMVGEGIATDYMQRYEERSRRY
jgi:NAD(P)-dependent dehydrogenase (short-subunit alcohol dehydrogenase family)